MLVVHSLPHSDSELEGFIYHKLNCGLSNLSSVRVILSMGTMAVAANTNCTTHLPYDSHLCTCPVSVRHLVIPLDGRT
jgi:hypothetical protein